MIAIVAKLPIKEGMMNDAVDVFKELITKMGNDEGTQMYSICVDSKNPNILVVVERYADEAAVKLHGSTDHFKACSQKLGAVIAGRPEISKMDVLASL
ncbi:MAG: antibiotic biosynthesis monooxygenase [Proteobacteria bacterium]|nr:antibiotic biosynthesis monooxygenase [Pseudomonadota bacterium]